MLMDSPVSAIRSFSCPARAWYKSHSHHRCGTVVVAQAMWRQVHPLEFVSQTSDGFFSMGSKISSKSLSRTFLTTQQALVDVVNCCGDEAESNNAMLLGGSQISAFMIGEEISCSEWGGVLLLIGTITITMERYRKRNYQSTVAVRPSTARISYPSNLKSSHRKFPNKNHKVSPLLR